MQKENCTCDKRGTEFHFHASFSSKAKQKISKYKAFSGIFVHQRISKRHEFLLIILAPFSRAFIYDIYDGGIYTINFQKANVVLT